MANKKLIYADSAKLAAEYMEKHLVAGESDFLNGYLAGVKALANGLAELPAVDAVEVVHGRTEVIEPFEVTLTARCCLCGVAMGNLDNYCPNCGAKMNLKGE